MTKLSVNLNKIALLRNSRGRDYPNVVHYAEKVINLGAHGITIHPRQDERHIKRTDAMDLSEFLQQYPQIELNIEGYPSDDFLQLIEITKPAQCTLVPDGENQLTSDHGWQISANRGVLDSALTRIHNAGVRAALFMDPDVNEIKAVGETGYDRIELYTEHYAETYGSEQQQSVIENYTLAKDTAVSMGLGVNAGHDLDLTNLKHFLAIGDILEVSIGHALTIESIDAGMDKVILQYLEICQGER